MPYPGYPGPHQHQLVDKQPNHRGGQLALAIVSLSLGVPMTAIALGTHAGNLALFIIWLGIVAVNAAFALVNRPPSS